MMRVYALAMASVLVPCSVAAQGPLNPPAINPLYLSLTGIDSEPEIYQAVTLSSYQLLSTSLQFKKDDTTQKVLFAPFKLSETYKPWLSDTLINIAQTKGVTTLGLGVGWTNSNPAGTRAADILTRYTTPAQKVGESDAEYDGKLHVEYDRFYRELARNALQITGGINTQLFAVIGGTKIDQDEDGKIDNQYAYKGVDLSLGVTYTANQGFGLSGAYHYTRKRATAVQDVPLVNYHGGSVTLAGRVAVLDKDYRHSRAYLKSLFIPSVLIGAALEHQTCKGEAKYCEDSLTRQTALTPFIDFRITQETQFRLGVPIKWTTFTGKESKAELTPVVQFSLQLSGK